MAVNEQEGRDISSDDGRIGRLYREASVAEPPARLDALIRAVARREARAGVHRERKPWWNPWRVPFAVAALAFVSASLVTLVVREGGDRVAQVTAPSAPRQSEPGPITDREATQATPAVTPLPADQRRLHPTAPRPRGAAELEPGPLSNSAPAPKVERDQPVAQDASPRKFSGPAALEKADGGPLAEGKTAAAEPARERVTMQPAPAAAPANRPNRQDARLEPPADIAALKAELENEVPARWVERIVALRREGRRGEADALLAEFKRRYPEEPLPPSLQ